MLSFTLISPLGMPWWAAVLIVAGATARSPGMGASCATAATGFWQGLDVLRGLQSRNVIIGLVMFATGAQVVRNHDRAARPGRGHLRLRRVALLIASAAVGLLPVGPTLGAATAVLILGSNGVAVVAAAGALLTATGAIGTLLFAGWALLDGIRVRRQRPARDGGGLRG